MTSTSNKEVPSRSAVALTYKASKVKLLTIWVTQEYGYLMCAIMVLANLGVQGLPSGPLSDCPCCWAAGGQAPAEGDAQQPQLLEGQGSKHPLPGMNVDFCFSLCHLARFGIAELQLPPPNQWLFLNHHPECRRPAQN